MFKTILMGVLCISFCHGNETSEEFYEVDTRKLLLGSNVKFGAQVHVDFSNRYRELIKSIGPVFQLAYWPAVWSVSPAAPAPHEADNETMDRWVGTIYLNLSPDIESMKNTSSMLVNEGVITIGAAISPPNSYYNTPMDTKKFRERIRAEKEGRKIEIEDLPPEEEGKEENRDKQYQIFMPESTPDFAKFWASSMEQLRKQKIALPILEVTWEPDNKEFVYISPEDFASVIKQTREQFRARGIPEDESLIVGPGTSSPRAAKRYIEVLAENRDAFDALRAWSIHIKDVGQSVAEMEKEILDLKQIIKDVIPSSWPQKPVIVTSFGYSPKTNIAFGDVEFNGDMDMCYRRIMGRSQRDDDNLPNTIAQFPTTGVRLLASLILQYSHGFDKVIYEELADTPWSHSCKGMFDRQDRKKQIYTAFSTLLTHIEKDTMIVEKQWKNKDNCVIVMLRSETRFLVSLANPSSTACSRSFSLSGLPTDYINEAFTVSYNNGTVSLAASDPSEVLVMKLPLDYDTYPGETSVDGEVVEFDVVVGPNASATAVINIRNKIQSKTKAEEATKDDIIHIEL